VAPGASFIYQFNLVNATDINAFALPGGYLYLNRGLIEAVENEGQLAGVMAHEMAHVALRHGTSQASKAYLGQTGLGLLGGLIGKDDHSSDDTIAALGGFGMNTLFLKFSRAAEEQADITGAQMMAAPPARRSESSGRPVGAIRVDGPSDDFHVFVLRDEMFQIEYPDNWRIYEADHGYGVTIAPHGGLLNSGDRDGDLVSGVFLRAG
jgi:hypothetical protein